MLSAMASARQLLIPFCLLAALGTLASCVTVKPYQRAALAHRAMQAPPWPAVQAADQHLFEVREATKGGSGRPGGGCGCN